MADLAPVTLEINSCFCDVILCYEVKAATILLGSNVCVIAHACITMDLEVAQKCGGMGLYTAYVCNDPECNPPQNQEVACINNAALYIMDIYIQVFSSSFFYHR